MQPTAIGIKELQRHLARITAAAHRGKSFVIYKHRTPLCQIEPITPLKKKFSWADRTKLIVSTKHKHLSRDVDRILYDV